MDLVVKFTLLVLLTIQGAVMVLVSWLASITSLWAGADRVAHFGDPATRGMYGAMGLLCLYAAYRLAQEP